MRRDLNLLLSIKLEKGDCKYCGNDCEGEHSFSDEKEFIDVCDDCLSDKLAELEYKEDLKNSKIKQSFFDQKKEVD
jgi:ribosome-binding protein aMBF1 (putative translation factor)